MHIRGLKSALNSSGRFKYKPPEFVTDHVIIGGGVVGLAIARALTLAFPEKSTLLVERNESVGEETSSRNSEVIHGGLYYPPDSLKERLCLHGRHLIYKYCDDFSVPYKKTGKLVVARDPQRPYIESLHEKCMKLRLPAHLKPTPETPALPTLLLTGDEVRDLEPDLSPAISAALLSPETGIIDSHTFIKSLEGEISGCSNGSILVSTTVVRVDPYEPSTLASDIPDLKAKENGWVVQMITRQADGSTTTEGDTVFARTLINAAGLSSTVVLNSLLPEEKRIPMYYARGSYAAYNGPGVKHVTRLLYPCPETKKDKHAFQSLGTHLTLDISGNIKFGPDLQWISPEGASQSDAGPVHAHDSNIKGSDSFSFKEDDVDFWKQMLTADDILIEEMYKAVKAYLPGVEMSKFRPNYVGIRPKLAPPWGGFQDFVFRRDHSTDFTAMAGKERGHNGAMISLLGIESPGLTASLAIAEEVSNFLDR